MIDIDQDKATLRTQGTVTLPDGEAISVILRIEHNKYDPQQVACEMNLLSQGQAMLAQHYSLETSLYVVRELAIRSNSSPQYLVRIEGISGWSTKANDSRVELDISRFDWGISDVPQEGEDKLNVIIRLTAENILIKPGISMFHWNGSITNEHIEAANIEWKTPLGKGIACVRYEYEHSSRHDNKHTIRIPQPSLMFDINNQEGLPLKEIQRILERESEDVCLLLSLCYRRPVTWYEMWFIPVGDTESRHPFQERLVHRRVSRRSQSDREDELINYRDLVRGGMEHLLTSYRASKHVNVLRRVISFLASSYSFDTPETKYFLCYSALDALCDTLYSDISSETTITSSQWKKLYSELKAVLQTFGRSEGIEQFAASATNNLSGLKRPSAKAKIVGCCEKAEVKVDDLWVKDGFEKGLQKAINLRNSLFHSAFAEDSHLLYANLARLQILTERIILKTINWPSEKICRWYDQKLHWIGL